MTWSSAGGNTLLNGLLITHFGLHSAFPGDNGANELSGGSYARKSATVPAAVNQARTWTGALDFSVPKSTVAWISFWSGSTYLGCMANGSNGEHEIRRIFASGAIEVVEHGLQIGDRVAIIGGDVSPLVAGQIVYVVGATTDQLNVSLTQGGAVLALAASTDPHLQITKILPEVYGGAGTFRLTQAVLALRWNMALVRGFRWVDPPTGVTLTLSAPAADLSVYLSGPAASFGIDEPQNAQLAAIGVTIDQATGVLTWSQQGSGGAVTSVPVWADDTAAPPGPDPDPDPDPEPSSQYFTTYTDRDLRVHDGINGSASGCSWFSWSKTFGLMPWNSPGGDRDTTNTHKPGGVWATGTMPSVPLNDPNAVGMVLTIDITELAQAIKAGTVRNFGFMLIRSSGTGNHIVASRENVNTAIRPRVIINNTVTVPGEADTTITSSSDSPTAPGAASTLTLFGTRCLLWFDIGGAQVSSITSARIELTRTNPASSSTQAASATYSLWRALHPNDPTVMPEPTFGIAANYVKDVGIETHADVVFTEMFPDANLAARWETGGALGGYWEVISDGTSNKKIANVVTGNDTFGNGMTALYPEQKSLRIKWAGRSDTFFPWTGNNGTGAMDAYPPGVNEDELYCRILWYIDPNWFPDDDGAKQIPGGWASRWRVHNGGGGSGIAGMRRGSSAEYPDGFGGSSVRGHSMPTNASTFASQNHHLFDKVVAFGYYHQDLTLDSVLSGYDVFTNSGHNEKGGPTYWNTKLLGLLERGRWYSIESYCKMNTVSANPLYRADLFGPAETGYPNSFRNNAELPATWPTTGNPTFFNGALTDTRGTINFFSEGSQWEAHTCRNDSALRNAVLARTPTKANYDGEYKLWVNGRLACHLTQRAMRHVLVCKDGVTPYGARPWFNGFVGGTVARYTNEHHTWLSNIVVSRSYIGPVRLS